jgi:hypothetical protein
VETEGDVEAITRQSECDAAPYSSGPSCDQCHSLTFILHAVLQPIFQPYLGLPLRASEHTRKTCLDGAQSIGAQIKVLDKGAEGGDFSLDQLRHLCRSVANSFRKPPL